MGTFGRTADPINHSTPYRAPPPAATASALPLAHRPRRNGARIGRRVLIFATPFPTTGRGGYMRASILIACVAVSVAGSSPAAFADPVVITGGVGNIGDDITGFEMTGPGT